MAAIHNHEHTTLISKQVHASIHTLNKTFILYTIHRHKIHEQAIFPRSFIFLFNSTIDSLSLIDNGKLFQGRHTLNNTEFMLQEFDFAASNLRKRPFLIWYLIFLKKSTTTLTRDFDCLKI